MKSLPTAEEAYDILINAINEIPDNVKPLCDKPLWDLDSRVLNPHAELPPVLTWGRMGNRPAIERQGIHTISAKPKQGKSLSAYAILQSIITGRALDTFVPTDKPNLVMVFDTEMHANTLQRRAIPYYDALGEEARRFAIVPLLSVAKSERLNVIAEMTQRFKPDIVLIDVVQKLVNDFNSADENAAFGDWLEKYAAERCVITIIHQNKAEGNSQMKGHLGSILAESAVENYTSSLKDGIFSLKPINARNTCAEGADAMSFVLDADNHHIKGASEELERLQGEERQKYITMLSPIFAKADELSHTKLRNAISLEFGMEERAARNIIESATKCGAIYKTSEEKKAPYRIAISH